MQRFGYLRRPVGAVVLAFCSVGLIALTGTIGGAVAQERPQGAGATQPQAGADSSDPFLVVTVASLNKLNDDINYITGAVGQPQAGATFTMFSAMFTQGLDPTRPIAVLVPMVDGAPEPIGLIPSNNVEMMIKRLEQQTGPADRLDDGTLVLAAGPALLYVRQVGNWAVVARNPDLIGRVPADPMPLLQGLGDSYDIAMRLSVQEVPLPLREMLVEQLSQGFQQAMARQQGDDEDVAQVAQVQLDQINQVIREADQVMFGFNTDPSKRILSMDIQFTAAPGTQMARMFAGQKPIPSMFSAVLAGQPALRYHFASSISPETIETTSTNMTAAKTMLRKALAESEDIEEDVAAEIEESLNGLLDIVVKTMEEGKVDGGMIGNVDDGTFRIAGGMFVHDGREVAAWLKQLATKLRSTADAPEFRFDEAEHGDVSLHSVVIDVPAKQEELRQMFGPQVTIRLGTGAQAVYFASGEGSENALRALIDSAEADRGDLSQRPLGQARLKLLPILRLAQSVKPDDSLAAVIDSVAMGGDNDYFSFVTNAIPNGQANYIEIGEGVLKAIGAAIREGQNAQMQQLQRGGGQF
jgi:hypothetical protein